MDFDLSDEVYFADLAARESNIEFNSYIKQFNDSLLLLNKINNNFVHIHPSIHPSIHINKVKNINSVLEIGCNEGLVCLLFGMAGYKTRGIDISPKCIEKFKRHYEYFASRSNETLVIDVNCNVLNLFDLPKTQFYDLVLLFKVLHHIPYSKLHECCDILKAIVLKGGYVLIEDPNLNGVPNLAFYINWIHNLLPRKLQCQFFKKRFTKTEFPIKARYLIDLFSLSGFEVVAFEYVKTDPIYQYAKLTKFNFVFQLLPKKLKALNIALLLKKVS